MRVHPTGSTVMSETIPVEIKANFFYDEDVAVTLGGRSIEELKGHMILLHSENAHDLKLSALIDGSTIDFLFGSKGSAPAELKNRVKNVKNYLRELTHEQQYQCCLFYYALMKEILSFQESMNHPLYLGLGRNTYCLCFHNDKNRFIHNVNEAYLPFYRSIYNLNNVASKPP